MFDAWHLLPRALLETMHIVAKRGALLHQYSQQLGRHVWQYVLLLSIAQAAAQHCWGRQMAEVHATLHSTPSSSSAPHVHVWHRQIWGQQDVPADR